MSTNGTTSAKPKKFISRSTFLNNITEDREILHLGCSSGSFLRDRLNRKSLLHENLNNVAKELYGIDLDADSLEIMRKELGFDNLFVGDVQELDSIPIDKKFDIVLAGDLLEHITCPGEMLNGVKRFLKPNGQFVISTVNAFGLHFQIRRWLGRYVEHFEHVCFYSPETLINLFERHGYQVSSLYGAYTEPPYTIRKKIKFAFGAPLFKLFPVLAGTLIVIAELPDNSN